MPLLAPRRVARRESGDPRARRPSSSISSASGRLTGAFAGTLSGGQRKLLELGRALMVEPRMILLDEPMAGVAPALAAELLDHIRALRDASAASPSSSSSTTWTS